MNESDLEIHSGFFPESSQVTLVIHPTGAGRAEAGFFAREADGSVRSEASYRKFILNPDKLDPVIVDDPLPPQAESSSDTEEIADSEPDLPVARIPEPSIPVPSVSTPSLPAPNFQIHEPLPARERWLWAIPIALALGLGAWLLQHQKQKPAENSPIAFRVTSPSPRTAQLEWDPNSRAVRDSERGQIDITDGGKSSQILLSADQLHGGKMTYLAQSGDVGFQLTVHPASGPPVHEATRLIVPAVPASAMPAPVEPPQLLEHSPAPPPVSDGEREALKKQVRQLTEDLRKEHARADQLQNLVRILEGRLGMQPEKPKPAPQP